jgi:hypothetical protein
LRPGVPGRADVFGDRIALNPDWEGICGRSGISQQPPLLDAVGMPEIMVAGAGFRGFKLAIAIRRAA